MGYFVALIVILLGLVFKKSKIVTFIMLFYCWAIIGLNTYTADFANYEEMYLCSFEKRYALHEPGYMLLCKFMLRMGLNYRQFRMVVAFLIVILLAMGLRYYTKNINYIFSLYLIFPFCSYASGLRTAVAVAIFIYGSKYLFADKKYSCLKYVIIVMIASTFHYSSLFYLLFLLVRYKKIGIDFCTVITGVLIVAAILLANTGILYTIGENFTTSEKVLQWLEFRGGYFSPLYILSIMLHICFYFVLYRATYITKLREIKGTIQVKNVFSLTSADMESIRKIAVLSLSSFAGAIFSTVVFLRLVLPPIPLCYAVIGEMLTKNSGDTITVKKEQIIWSIVIPLFCFCVAIFIFGYWIGGDVLHIYVNNLLFQ